MSTETIDGIRGRWKTVTNPSQVKTGQLIQLHGHSSTPFGLTSSDRIRMGENGRTDDGLDNPFDGYWKTVKAFFPVEPKAEKKVVIGTWERMHTGKRKTAKVTVGSDWDAYGKQIFHFIVKMNRWHFIVTPKFGGAHYSSRKSAIRGAKRFCKTIGFEMELVK